MSSDVARRKVNENISTGLFGGWDGVLSCYGILIALYRVSGSQTIIRASLGAAVAAAISMATAQYEADQNSSLVKAGIMGVATGCGGFLPCLPFFFLQKTTALAVSTTLAVLGALLVAHIRRREMDKSRWTYLTSPAILLVAAALTLGITMLVPESAQAA